MTGQAGSLSLTKRITVRTGDPYVHVTITAKVAGVMNLAHLLSSYTAFPGDSESHRDQRPDFVFTPQLRPEPQDVIGDHIFRSPALMMQRDTRFVAMLPEPALMNTQRRAVRTGADVQMDGGATPQRYSYREFLEKNPNLYQVELSIGDCLREMGEFDKAIETYKAVVEHAKLDVTLGKEMTAKALAGIGNCYLKQGKINEAQDLFRQSIENSPKDEILAYNVGEIYFSNQALDDALRYFELAAQIKPDWPDPYLKLGYVYLNKADNPKAVEKFEKFIALEPEGERAALARNILNVIKK